MLDVPESRRLGGRGLVPLPSEKDRHYGALVTGRCIVNAGGWKETKPLGADADVEPFLRSPEDDLVVEVVASAFCVSSGAGVGQLEVGGWAIVAFVGSERRWMARPANEGPPLSACKPWGQRLIGRVLRHASCGPIRGPLGGCHEMKY